MDEHEQQQLRIQDPAVMRALAHPARLAILTHLRPGVEATATELSELVALSPSATSYHLRALAKAGLLAEAPGRGDGRERVWRSVANGFAVESGPATPPETQAAGLELMAQFLLFQEAAARRWVDRSTREPQEWWDAAMFSDSMLLVSAEELEEVNRRVLEVLRPYSRERRTAPPAGARLVSAVYRVFPVDET